MERPLHTHLTSQELKALVPWSPDEVSERPGLSPKALPAAEGHVQLCLKCSTAVSKYKEIVNTVARARVSPSAGTACIEYRDVDWQEVAAGLWPELRAKQLIMHAALCEHCGPHLRAAVSKVQALASAEQHSVAKSRTPGASTTVSFSSAAPSPWQILKWWVPAVAAMVLVGVLSSIPTSLHNRLSGEQFAEVAVRAHKQHAQGRLALQVRSESQQTLNDWFKQKAPFTLALPDSDAIPAEQRPFKLEGARLVQFATSQAGFIAYHVQATGSQGSSASLMVVPDSVAVASGGVRVDFKKVSFHYAMVERYRVVTWSVHGLTYALVSQEQSDTQRSCMVCHSALRDRDLSHTPIPLPTYQNTVQALWQ